LRLMTVLPAAIFIFVRTLSHADVFRYVDENGVICFTDCPKKKGAVRIMRDRKKTSRATAKVVANTLPKTGKTDTTIKPLWKNDFLDGMTMPVKGRISSTVGLRHDPIDGLLRFHNGVDIAIPEGTPVRPVAPGTVYFSGAYTGYGNMMIIKHDDGMISIYAHNSLNLMKVGERVGKDTTIALSGSTGHSTGPHLHFEVWKNGDNLTDTFLGRMSSDNASFVAVRQRRDIIRTSLKADGSILFTNLP